jgi:hypothetical protein
MASGMKKASEIMERTFINRDELLGHLLRADIELVVGGQRRGEDPMLVLTKPISYHYMTEPRTKKGIFYPAKDTIYTIKSRSLFTSTGKMTAGSFSTPAGPPQGGVVKGKSRPTNGACVAAAITPGYTAFKDLGDVDQSDVEGDGKKFICRSCYANKSNYMHRGPQSGQLMRHIWLKKQLDENSPEEVGDILAEALAAHASNLKKREKMEEDPRFFRIHDSGDLFSKKVKGSFPGGIKALLAWYRVCRIFDGKINFWCPTRMWVFPEFTQFVQDNPPPRNLSLRPSALHFDDTAPMIDGFTAGTTAHFWQKDKQTRPVQKGIADLACPAYAGGGKSCGGALARAQRDTGYGSNPTEVESLNDLVRIAQSSPALSELTNGGSDCRACWLFQDTRVSYKAH